MTDDKKARDAGYYREISRITLEGLSEISNDFVEFHSDLTNRLTPALTGMAQNELPEASDQLNAIIETTETATDIIMDNLEAMQQEQERIRAGLEALLSFKRLAAHKRSLAEDGLAALEQSQVRIMKIFEELSFQDLTGQRIKRIVTLVRSIEDTVHGILDNVGQRVSTEPAAPAVPEEAVEVSELKGPQKAGEGMDQAAIDALLADL